MNHDNIVIGKNNRKNSLIKENFYPIVEDKPEYTYFNEEANLKLLPADKESSPFNI